MGLDTLGLGSEGQRSTLPGERRACLLTSTALAPKTCLDRKRRRQNHRECGYRVFPPQYGVTLKTKFRPAVCPGTMVISLDCSP